MVSRTANPELRGGGPQVVARADRVVGHAANVAHDR